MKKILSFLSSFAFLFTTAQVTIYEEGFNDGVQPSDWTTEVTGPGQWYLLVIKLREAL